MGLSSNPCCAVFDTGLWLLFVSLISIAILRFSSSDSLFFAQKCKLDVTEQEVEEVLGEIKIDSQRTRNIF